MFRFNILLIAIFIMFGSIKSQDFRPNTSAKYTTWFLMQLIPSPTLYQDSDNNNSRLQFGFKWHITPINISFTANKYVSPVQFFMINPVRRFTGSAELFIQPELSTSSFKYADMSVFGISTGSRLILPITDRGEAVSISIGGKYTYRKNFNEEKNYYYSVETGIYFVGGLIGFQFTKNFNERTKYNLNFYIKYF